MNTSNLYFSEDDLDDDFGNKKYIKEKNSLYFLILCLTVLSVSIWLTSMPKAQSNIVATVNTEPITKAEFCYFMLLNKAEVYNYIYRTFNTSYSDGFWNKFFDGQSALERLKQQSLNAAINYKVQQILAKKKGIKAITNFNELMERRKRVNKNRIKKAKDGEVIYGPVRLSTRNYVDKVRDEMIQSTKNILSKNDFKVPSKEMKWMYQIFKKNFNTVNNKKKLDYQSFRNIKQHEYTTNKYKQLIQKMVDQAEVQINESVYMNIDMLRSSN